MRRKNKKTIEPKYILIASLVLCLVLILVSFRYEQEMKPAKTVVGNCITPMQKGINILGIKISDSFDKFASMEALIAENNALKEENASVLNENKLLMQDRYELENLRKLYKLDEKYSDYPKVAARVISNDTNNWYSVFTIDKGADDGITVNMNVMAGNGLVGIVTEVGHNYAKVRSIIDDSSYVSGMFLKTADLCMVKGDLKLLENGHIAVEEINKDAKVYNGYEIVTSHISDKYLQGILIGYISDLKTDSSNMTKSGLLTPVVDFNKLEVVLVITVLKEELVPLEKTE